MKTVKRQVSPIGRIREWALAMLKQVQRTGKTSGVNGYARKNSTETIFKELKSRDAEIALQKLDSSIRGKDSLGETDGRGNISLKKDGYESFLNAVDKLLEGKGDEITAREAGATLTYWHERTHNLPKALLSQAKFEGDQKHIMELVTEFYAQKTLPEFYKMFDAELPKKIDCRSGYATYVDNFQTVVNKLIEAGGINENDVLAKIREHLINGQWEDQKSGLVNAWYGAKIEGKIVDKRTLGAVVTAAAKYPDYTFKRRMNKLLGIKQ
jgi:hypothetical protein